MQFLGAVTTMVLTGIRPWFCGGWSPLGVWSKCSHSPLFFPVLRLAPAILSLPYSVPFMDPIDWPPGPALPHGSGPMRAWKVGGNEGCGVCSTSPHLQSSCELVASLSGRPQLWQEAFSL